MDSAPKNLLRTLQERTEQVTLSKTRDPLGEPPENASIPSAREFS